MDVVLEVLDEDSRQELEHALVNRLYTISAIAAALQNLGVDVSESTVRRWRTQGKIT